MTCYEQGGWCAADVAPAPWMLPVHALKPSIHRASEERVWANQSKISNQSSMVVCERVARESRATVGWHHIQVACEERGDESAHDLEVVRENVLDVLRSSLAVGVARSSLRRALERSGRASRADPIRDKDRDFRTEIAGVERGGARRAIFVFSRKQSITRTPEWRCSNRLLFRTQPKSYTTPHVELETHTSAARFTHKLAMHGPVQFIQQTYDTCCPR